MNHYDKQEWLLYINRQIPEGIADEMEHHLYSCEECLSAYLMAIELASPEMPAISSDESVFAEQVLNRTTRLHKSSSSKRTFLHYAIAAAATLILMTSGVFHSLSQQLEQMENSKQKQSSISISETLLDHTLTWLDTLQSKGGNSR